jgi:hypothetical protein
MKLIGGILTLLASLVGLGAVMYAAFCALRGGLRAATELAIAVFVRVRTMAIVALVPGRASLKRRGIHIAHDARDRVRIAIALSSNRDPAWLMKAKPGLLSSCEAAIVLDPARRRALPGDLTTDAGSLSLIAPVRRLAELERAIAYAIDVAERIAHAPADLEAALFERAIGDDWPSVRANAALELERRYPRSRLTRDAVTVLLVDPDLEARLTVARALGEAGFDAIEEVARRSTSTPLAVQAMTAIAETFPPARARAAARRALTSRNIEGAALAVAIDALARIDGGALLEDVVALADRCEADLRAGRWTDAEDVLRFQHATVESSIARLLLGTAVADALVGARLLERVGTRASRSVLEARLADNAAGPDGFGSPSEARRRACPADNAPGPTLGQAIEQALAAIESRIRMPAKGHLSIAPAGEKTGALSLPVMSGALSRPEP